MNTQIGVGIDISKANIDVATSDGLFVGTFPRTQAGVEKAMKRVGRARIHRVVVEATGGYEARVVKRQELLTP